MSLFSNDLLLRVHPHQTAFTTTPRHFGSFQLPYSVNEIQEMNGTDKGSSELPHCLRNIVNPGKREPIPSVFNPSHTGLFKRIVASQATDNHAVPSHTDRVLEVFGGIVLLYIHILYSLPLRAVAMEMYGLKQAKSGSTLS